MSYKGLRKVLREKGLWENGKQLYCMERSKDEFTNHVL